MKMGRGMPAILTVYQERLPADGVEGIHHRHGHHELQDAQYRQTPVHANQVDVCQEDAFGRKGRRGGDNARYAEDIF